MMSFRIRHDSGTAIEIDLDWKGLQSLMQTLSKLRDAKADHVHLLSSAIGGNDLDEQNPWGEPAIDEVIINYAEGDDAPQ